MRVCARSYGLKQASYHVEKTHRFKWTDFFALQGSSQECSTKKLTGLKVSSENFVVKRNEHHVEHVGGDFITPPGRDNMHKYKQPLTLSKP